MQAIQHSRAGSQPLTALRTQRCLFRVGCNQSCADAATDGSRAEAACCRSPSWLSALCRQARSLPHAKGTAGTCCHKHAGMLLCQGLPFVSHFLCKGHAGPAGTHGQACMQYSCKGHCSPPCAARSRNAELYGLQNAFNAPVDPWLCPDTEPSAAETAPRWLHLPPCRWFQSAQHAGLAQQLGHS